MVQQFMLMLMVRFMLVRHCWDNEYLIGDVEQGIDLAKQEAIKNKLELILKKCFSCHYFSNCGGACFARWIGCGDESEQELECCLKITAIDCYQQER